MKKLLYLITLVTSISFAQEGISYQAVAYDSEGFEISNQDISIRLGILLGGVDAEDSYTEVHSVTTDDFGMFSLVISEGETSDTFSSINWEEGAYLKVEVDEDLDGEYVLMGVSSFNAVPYALYAEKSSSDSLLEVLSNKVSDLQKGYTDQRDFCLEANHVELLSDNIEADFLDDWIFTPKIDADGNIICGLFIHPSVSSVTILGQEVISTGMIGHFLFKITPNGELIWHKSVDLIYHMSIDYNDNSIFTVGTKIIKYSSDGELLFENTIDGTSEIGGMELYDEYVSISIKDNNLPGLYFYNKYSCEFSHSISLETLVNESGFTGSNFTSPHNIINVQGDLFFSLYPNSINDNNAGHFLVKYPSLDYYYFSEQDYVRGLESNLDYLFVLSDLTISKLDLNLNLIDQKEFILTEPNEYYSYGPTGLNISDNKVQLFLGNQFHSFIYDNKYFTHSYPEHSSLITLNNDLSIETATTIFEITSNHLYNGLIVNYFQLSFCVNDIFYPSGLYIIIK
jgi:hypothetical protein